MRTIHALAIVVAISAPSLTSAQKSPFNAARLEARADSFVLSIAGNQAGYMTEELSKQGDSFRLRNTTQMGQRMSQTTDVTMSSTLALRAVKQTGQVGPNAMSIDVAVTNDHATGNATTPGQGGMESVKVDVQLPTGAIDDNALQFLLSTVTLTAGAKYDVDMFSSGKGEVKRVALTVGEQESVTVPAGTFDAHRVRLEGGPTPVSFWVTAAPTQRVVKVSLEGSPMSFLLAR
jgi:hypothetical protein